MVAGNATGNGQRNATMKLALLGPVPRLVAGWAVAYALVAYFLAGARAPPPPAPGFFAGLGLPLLGVSAAAAPTSPAALLAEAEALQPWLQSSAL